MTRNWLGTDLWLVWKQLVFDCRSFANPPSTSPCPLADWLPISVQPIANQSYNRQCPPLCWRHTVPKLFSDGHTNTEIRQLGSDRKNIVKQRENIGPFVRASYAINKLQLCFYCIRINVRKFWGIFGMPKEGAAEGTYTCVHWEPAYGKDLSRTGHGTAAETECGGRIGRVWAWRAGDR